MILSAVIIDDDQINIKLISSLIKIYCPDVSIKGTATNVDDGIKAVIKHKPRILFLDIQIHNKTGFDLLKVLDDPAMQVILVTAFEKYALQAFKYSVVDYLLKPINFEELISAVNKCKVRLESVAKNEDKVTNSLEFLGVRHKSEVELLRFTDIIHLESAGGYTQITLTFRKKIFSSRSLKETEMLLPAEMFIRIHNSHIINTRHIARYLSAKASLLVMTNGDQIPISSVKKKHVLELLNI